MYRWDYVKGQRAPVVVLDGRRRPTVRRRCQVAVLERGHARSRPGRLDPLRVGLRRRRHGRLARPEPDLHVHDRSASTRPSSRCSTRAARARSANTTITVGNTAPTVVVDIPGRWRHCSRSATTSRTRSRSPTPRTGRSTATTVEVTFVLGHDTHGHAETTTNGCSGVLPTDPRRTSRTAATCSASISARYDGSRRCRRRPVADDRRPEPDPPEAPGSRVRRQPDRARTSAPSTDVGGGSAARQPEQRRLDPAQRSVQPAEHRVDHVPDVRVAPTGPHPGRSSSGATR